MSPQNSSVAALTISVAITGAGLIAVASVSPSVPNVQVRAVHLIDIDTADSPLGDGTALVFGGTGVPIPPSQFVDAADTLYLQPLGSTGTAQSAFIPNEFFPTTGVKSLELATSLGQDQQTMVSDLFLGPTWLPDPAILPGYEPTIESLYLAPLGFSGSIATLITPETIDFGPSIAQGETDLINAVETDYTAGDFNAEHPLTIVTYSQSTVEASLAEPVLAEYGIASSALHFVMLGDAAADPPTGPTGILDTLGNTALGEFGLKLFGWSNLIDVRTPNDLYPTDVYDVKGEFFADYPTAAEQLWIPGLLQHGDYNGLTEAEIQSATVTVDDLTTYHTIADPANLVGTLFDTVLNNLGL
jgi:PE-PPE domain